MWHDANKNGKLDPDEIAKAKAEFGAMRRGRDGQQKNRAEMLKKFDADGDGKLNADERAKAIQELKGRKAGVKGARNAKS